MMRLTIYAAGLIMAAGAAHAQVTTGSTSQSDNQAIAVAEDVGGGGGGSGWTHESGHLYGTPSVYAPSFANANPCTQPVSAGGAGGPIGLTLGFSPENASCERLQKAAALWTLARGLGSAGLATAAVALMCKDRETADAVFSSTGEACPGTQDQARYKAAKGVFMISAPAAAPVQPTGWHLSGYAQRQLAGG